MTFLGKERIHYQEIDSTQLEVWRRIEKNEIKNGMLISAERQTNGKGTHGRRWYTEEKNNVAFSFVIMANSEIKRWEGITIEIAETLLQVFKKYYHISLSIKSPNDLVYHGKKIGGILTETKLKGEQVKYMVIGIRHEYQSNRICSRNRTNCFFY